MFKQEPRVDEIRFVRHPSSCTMYLCPESSHVKPDEDCPTVVCFLSLLCWLLAVCPNCHPFRSGEQKTDVFPVLSLCAFPDEVTNSTQLSSADLMVRFMVFITIASLAVFQYTSICRTVWWFQR